MIDFQLDGLHPSYERPVRDTLLGLSSDFPIVGDLRVELFDGDGDESLGCAPVRGVIRLNKYWFGRAITDLRDAARPVENMVRVGSVQIGYHGGMEEPVHVLTHEFGHQLQFAYPAWKEFAESHWRQACADPVHCRPPSGYACTSADEFFADCFAAMRLNYESEMSRLMREFLHRA